MDKKEKTARERQKAYDSLPQIVKDSLTPEEKELFLSADTWPDTLFEKLDEFIIKEE